MKKKIILLILIFISNIFLFLCVNIFFKKKLNNFKNYIRCKNGSMIFTKTYLFIVFNNLLHTNTIYKKNIKKKYILYNLTNMHNENLYIKYLNNYIIDINKLNKNDEYENIQKLIRKSITKEEEELFDFFKQVNEKYNLNSTLRVAGGWVRDKYFNIQNKDIDMTVDNMKGSEFCNYIKQFLKEKNKNFNFGLIKINSEKSKHLETASFRLFNFQVDIVNLRNEKYTQDSRIPHIIFGTPEEDAFRRDFTLNSLFYNLKNNKVEDFTNKGIFHLKEKIISTPLDPLSTFLDDPLRIIRGIRFCGYFNFYLDKSIYDILKNDDIKNSFSKKITKSRLSTELMKIFDHKCKNIVLCLSLMNYSSYSSLIFLLPSNIFTKDINHLNKYIKNDNEIKDNNSSLENNVNNSSLENNIDNYLLENNIDNYLLDNNIDNYLLDNNIDNIDVNTKINYLKKNWMHEGLEYIKFYKGNEENLLNEIFIHIDFSDNINYINFCLFFLPLNKYYYKKRESNFVEHVIEYIVKESIKFPMKYAKFCIFIYNAFLEIYNIYKKHEILNYFKQYEICNKKYDYQNNENNNKNNNEQNVNQNSNDLFIKANIVIFLKNIGNLWSIILFIFYIYQKHNEEKILSNIKNYTKKIKKHHTTDIDIYPSEFVKKLYHYILKNDLKNVYNIKPFIKWPELKNNFPNINLKEIKISQIYDEIIKYMIIYGENEKDCIKYLKEHFKKYT